MSTLLDLLGLVWLVGSVLFSLIEWAAPAIIFIAFVVAVGAIGRTIEEAVERGAARGCGREWGGY